MPRAKEELMIIIFHGHRQINSGKWSWMPNVGERLVINHKRYRILESTRRGPTSGTLIVEPEEE